MHDEKPKKPLFFTLVELLVVIGIIMLLMSILLPSLEKSKKMAFSIECKSRLKQIATCSMNYTSDNGGIFQLFDYPSGTNPYGWPNMLFRNGYLTKNQDMAGRMLQCPNEPVKMKGIKFWDYNNYGVIAPRSNDSYFFQGGACFNFNKVLTASVEPLFVDSAQDPDNCNYHVYKTPDLDKRSYYLRHSLKANFAFFDGHVASLDRSEVCSLPHFSSPTIKY